MSAARLLALDASTLFTLSDTGRILRENDPDQSPGPTVFFAGCSDGNQIYVHQRVDNDVTTRALKLLAEEPLWLNPDTLPAAMPAVLSLLESETHGKAVERSLIYQLPHRPVVAGDLTFICSGSKEGAWLLNDLQHNGMPKHLVGAGFVSLHDFWAPWCVVMDKQTIAALAFAARLGAQGAEVGVYTFPGWRSQGFAAAVTAKWSSLPDLAGLELFYSSSRENRSSRKVAERLGLQCFAAGLRIS